MAGFGLPGYRPADSCLYWTGTRMALGVLLVKTTQSHRVWTIAEAKARLSEILRFAESEGPQRIGTRKSFVVVPAHVWDAQQSPRKPLGQWLIENMPRGIDIELPDRSSTRMTPFMDGEVE